MKRGNGGFRRRSICPRRIRDTVSTRAAGVGRRHWTGGVLIHYAPAPADPARRAPPASSPDGSEDERIANRSSGPWPTIRYCLRFTGRAPVAHHQHHIGHHRQPVLQVAGKRGTLMPMAPNLRAGPGRRARPRSENEDRGGLRRMTAA
jgi:hypothetical protein